MNEGSTAVTGTPPGGLRRSDAGTVRLTGRDVAGLVLCGDMYGAPYDLLAACLGVREDRLRGIVARWRKAGYVQTGRLGPGPAWCWLTRPGLAAAGLGFAPSSPSLARLAHIRAVLAVRLSLESGAAWQAGAAHWRSERRIRAAMSGRIPSGHVPDAEVSWPDLPASPYPGGAVGHRGRADAQAPRPDSGDHGRAAGPHRGLPPRRRPARRPAL
jgi:hypothetical protein